MRTVFFLVRKEFLQIFRDRTTVFQIFMIPVVQLLVLANADLLVLMEEIPAIGVQVRRTARDRLPGL